MRAKEITPKETLVKLKKRFKHEMGRHRLTLLINEKWVVKLPLVEHTSAYYDDCHDANLREAVRYAKYKKKLLENIEAFEDQWGDVRLARCKMINFRGRAALLMERFVIDLGFDKYFHYEDEYDLPGWAGNWDCNQVGVMKDGSIALYDYAEG